MTEQRCPHGFIRSRFRCADCGPLARGPMPPRPPPSGHRCEAIVVSRGMRGEGWQQGKPCGRDAPHVFDGRRVCWVHNSACVSGPRADGSAMPVLFAEAP